MMREMIPMPTNRTRAGSLLMVTFLGALGGAVGGGCAAPMVLPPGFAQWLDESPDDMAVRFTTDGDRLQSVAIPLDYRQLPETLRRIADAIAPGGEVEYFARELGAREGWRMEKRYVPDDPAAPTLRRTLLLGLDGEVLERSHQIPLGEVPQQVLRGALDFGRDVERAEVVQADGEWFRLQVRNAFGWHHVVDLDADGAVRGAVRVKNAEIRGAAGSRP